MVGISDDFWILPNKLPGIQQKCETLNLWLLAILDHVFFFFPTKCVVTKKSIKGMPLAESTIE